MANRKRKKENIIKKIKKIFNKRVLQSRLRFNVMETIIFMLVTFAFGLIIGGIVMYGKGYFRSSTSLNEFVSTYNDIVDSYYTEVNQDELLEAGINGMINYLGDPYAAYMGKENAENFNDDVEGIYHGIGVELKYDEKTKKYIINKVFENSPSDKAGLKENDELIKINETDIRDTSMDSIASMVKGEDNTKVKITIIRDNKEMTFDVVRGIVDNISVGSRIIKHNGKKVGYIGISIFASNTYKQFKTQLEDLEKKKIDSLIIDVRGNSGGYLTIVTDIVSLFVSRGKPIYQLQTKDKIEIVNDETSEERDYSIVILTNGASASASEVLTAALKESYGAKSVGTKTYGKGKVQKVYSLSSGALVKYTFQEWLTPKGNKIDKNGISPDVEIKFDITKNVDVQLQEALEIITK